MLGYSVQSLPRIADLSESISCREPGLSFLTLPANAQRLDSCTQSFIHMVFSVSDTKNWTRQRAITYTTSHNSFLTILLLLIYQTFGQSARGPEILSIKVCNTENTLRNIFLYLGQFCILTQYNKSRSGAILPFYIIRFLPPYVSRLLYHYLVYIRPFVRYLQTKFNLPQAQHPQYLWPTYQATSTKPPTDQDLIESDLLGSSDRSSSEAEDEDGLGGVTSVQNQGYWSTRVLTRALRASSKKQQLSMTFTVALYRQVVIGITKKHLYLPSYQEKNGPRESEAQHAIHKLFA